MLKPLLTCALFAAALTVTSPALAQAPAQAQAGKKEMVARILQLQQAGIEALARSLTEQPAMQIMQQAGPAVQRLPAERREAVARDIEADLRKYAEEAVPIVSARAVKLAPSTIGALLEERLDAEELRQVIAMLESPVIRKFQAMAPEMQAALTQKLVAETKADIEPKVRAMQDSVARRLGVPAAPRAGGSTPAKK